MKKAFLFLLLGCLIACAQEKSATDLSGELNEIFPAPIGWVSDFSGVLSFKEKQELSSLIEDFEKKTTNEIAIVTIDSIGRYDTIFDYSLDLANHWGIGKKHKNNGVLLVICPPMKELRIQTGLGVEALLNDEKCQEIIELDIIPHLKENNWHQGIKQGLTAIMEQLEN